MFVGLLVRGVWSEEVVVGVFGIFVVFFGGSVFLLWIMILKFIEFRVDRIRSIDFLSRLLRVIVNGLFLFLFIDFLIRVLGT